MKHTRLKKEGTSDVSELKRLIQAQLRILVIQRDGGCLLRGHPQAGECGGYTKMGELILQAEHLNGRANSVSYGEPDNIVCLCKYHHLFFKRQHNDLYWVLIRERIGLDRWLKVETWIKDRKPHKFYASDWRKILENLNALNHGESNQTPGN